MDNCVYATTEKVAVVHVVDFRERSMVLRVLSKGANATATWELRCQIREDLIKRFRQEELPMPQIRFRDITGQKKAS